MNILQAILYFNLTPNGSGGEHFAPASRGSVKKWFAKYNSKLFALCDANPQTQRYAYISIYRFDLNDGYFDIDDSVLQGDGLYPTYLSVEFGDKSDGYAIFYFVDRVIFTGNGARLYVSVDYWATHIASAAFSDITVLKTNKLLSDNALNLYTYEQLKSPTEAGQKQFYSRRTYGMANLAVYAVITYKERETATDYIERTILARFNLFVNSAVPSQPTRAELLSLIEMASNIYEIAFDLSASYKSASVSKLYLDINPNVPIKTGTQVHTLLNNGAEKTLACDVISQGYIVENYYIGDRDYLQAYPANATFPVVRIPKLTGYKVSVGTFGNYLELPPFVGFMGVTFERIFGYDGITYKLSAGGNELDLTPNFQIATTLNRASLTAQEKTQKTLSVMSGVIGAGAQIVTGGITGAISGTLSLANTFANIRRNDKGQVLSVGDALLTFAGVIGFYNIPASDIIIGVSVDRLNAQDAPDHTEAINYINANGANCSIAIETDDLLNKLSEAHPIFNGQKYGFYQLNCTVDNIPYDASEAITGEFQQGVKITFIEWNG